VDHRTKKLQLRAGRATFFEPRALISGVTRIGRIEKGKSGKPVPQKNMNGNEFIVHSRKLPAGQPGELLRLPREVAGWEWMSFSVYRLNPGESYEANLGKEEAVFVVLGGKCLADWGEVPTSIGKRKNVFDGFPYALYLPAGSRANFTGETACEIAECRVPSDARLAPKLITPSDVVSSLRGGGNASRQIVDVIRPDFPADKLVVVEVYTPGGNWSSYPPHKHDVHNPPKEVDLDEIYYYRIEQQEGFALQHLYSADRSSELTLRPKDGDVVLVRSGYHPVVAGPGYNVYYLNFLAGSSRMLAVTEDANHVWIRDTWKEIDSRLPLIRG
jgi:5-deoxy-glucuronate isomerase